jgi:hypothetical protein
VRARGQVRARGWSGSGSGPGPQSVSDLMSGLMGGARPSARAAKRLRGAGGKAGVARPAKTRWAAAHERLGWKGG